MYNYTKIEKKWQKYWEDNKTFKTDIYDFSRPKYYVLDMFPYPSGVGLHAGHPEGYTATDIMARMKRMQGYNVLHPMGYDSFGLPAEQYAIQTGNHPKEFTEKNIAHFREQLKRLGFSYDWDREISTSDPKFYKWTQWIFKELYKDGYANYVDMPVNWCEELGKENYVFISEYYMPSNFQCIWSKERMVLQKSDREKGEIAVEKLFTIGKSKANNLEKDIFDL